MSHYGLGFDMLAEYALHEYGHQLVYHTEI